MIDYYVLYRILERMITPFKKWKAYEDGIIDENGKILEPKKLNKFDVFMLNVKKLIEKAPGGKTRLASWAAALYLMKEHNSSDERLDSLMENLEEELSFITEEVGVGAIAGVAPTNNIGSGNIKGYDPLLRKKPVSRKKSK